MRAELLNAVLPRLAEYKFKESKDWLQQGECPNCGKKVLYTRASAPWVLRCNRLENCGYEAHIKDLWPDLFNDWSKRAADAEKTKPQEKRNPHAAADLYLAEARGFDLKRIKGWYEQAHYADPQTLEGTATVRFPLLDKYWERFIDRPERFGKRKATVCSGLSYGGHWWVPPSLNDEQLRLVKELWIVEGIFDAIALLHNDIDAVSIISCTNYPEKALKSLEDLRGDKRGITLVWALDRGVAGEKFLKDFFTKATAEGWNCKAALPPLAKDKKKQKDWNDLHLLERLTPRYVADYLYYGALLVAKSAAEKAYLMREKTKKNSFNFDYQNRLYFLEFNAKKVSDAKNTLLENGIPNEWDEEDVDIQALAQSGSVQLISQCNPKALYYQRNELTDESWYYYKIDYPHNSKCSKGTFTSSQLSSPGEFKKRLLHLARGAIYTGKPYMLDAMLTDHLYNIKEVKTVNYIGYSKEYDVYVFNDFAMQDGKVIPMNDEDYFDLKDGVQLKSLANGVEVNINTDPSQYKEHWMEWLWQCSGVKGYVALIYWFGSLFAEQIRRELDRFPFLEIIGDPGAGKSTFLEFFWKLSGRLDYEGFNPGKSSFAGRSRTFEQVSNLPVALIEADYGGEEKSHKGKAFDFDETKDLFNGRPIRTLGQKNMGTETHAPPFRASLVIAQNNPVVAQKAVLERICQIHLTLADHSDAGAAAASKLSKVEMEEISYFMIKAIKTEKETLQIIKDTLQEYEHEIKSRGQVFISRLAFTHGLLMSLTDAFAKAFNLSQERHAKIHHHIFEMAASRQIAVNSDCKEVHEFWEAYEFLHVPNNQLYDLNHSANLDTIAINLNHFYAVAREKGQPLPELTHLRNVIKTSVRHKFIAHKSVSSAVMNGKTTKCYVFEAKSSAKGD